MKDAKEIEKIAHRIVEIEKALHSKYKTTEECDLEMQSIIKDLSLEELLMVDEYIIEKQLLKK